MSPAKTIKMRRFVPFEFLKLRKPCVKLGNRRSSEGLQNFKPSKGTNLLTLTILAGDIEISPGPRFLCRLCKKYYKATDKFVTMTAKSAFMRHVQIPAKKKTFQFENRK